MQAGTGNPAGDQVTPRTFLVDSETRRAKLLAILAKLPLAKPWEVLVKDYDPKRSTDSNRRLWALHQAAAAETGHSVEEMHEFAKLRFLPRHMVTVGGIRQEVASSSAKLSKQEFREFMDRTEAFYISELGVFLE